MFDFMSFFSTSVSGLPLVLVVMGLVTWISQAFNLAGKQSLIASMVVGLLLGAGFQISQAMPGDFSGWFAVVIYGLVLGLFASGVYDTGKKIAVSTKL